MKKIPYKNVVKIARKMGLIEKGKYDLRQSLTPAQKGAITKLHNKHQALIERPQDFKRVRVLTKTATNITGAAKKINRKGGKTDLYIPIEKDEKVKIKRGKIEKTKGKFRERIIGAGSDLYEAAKNAFEKLKPGQAISFQIGGNKKFNRFYMDIRQFEEAMNYLHAKSVNRQWNTTQPLKGSVDSMIEHFSVVTFDIGGKDFDEDFIDYSEFDEE